MNAPAPRIDVEQVRRAVSLLDLVPAGAEVKRIGRDKYVTLCVFHSEDRPSMRLTLWKGVWRYRCFPCGANGDAVDFVMKTRGVSFQDAIKLLADGRTLDLSVTTATRRHVPKWLLVCDARGCTSSLEVEDEDVVYLGETLALGWWVGRHRAYCPACVAERLGRDGCPPLRVTAAELRRRQGPLRPKDFAGSESVARGRNGSMTAQRSADTGDPAL